MTDNEYINGHYIILVTKLGIVKKTLLEAYSRPRQNGVNAITIREGDQLLEAKLTNGNYEIVLGVRSGKAVRFNEQDIRPVGRTASGVKGVNLSAGDEVIGMVVVGTLNQDILVVSSHGYGKRSSLEDYRITKRGTKGVKTMNITDKTGKLVSMLGVIDTDDLMIITKNGLTIRLPISDLRVMGRATQGVKLINLRKGDQIAAVEFVPAGDKEENAIENEEGIVTDEISESTEPTSEE